MIYGEGSTPGYVPDGSSTRADMKSHFGHPPEALMDKIPQAAGLQYGGVNCDCQAGAIDIWRTGSYPGRQFLLACYHGSVDEDADDRVFVCAAYFVADNETCKSSLLDPLDHCQETIEWRQLYLQQSKEGRP